MKAIKKKLSVFVLAGMLAVMLENGNLVSAENQGTDGTEIQVMEAEQLEVQLGKEWAGRKFQLKTDAGLYPGTITVGEDGVLRTELGGSSRYILTCMLTGNTDDSGEIPAVEESVTEEQTDALPSGRAGTVAGIPIRHLVLFSVGMPAAAGSLLVIHFVQGRREEEEEYGEEDYDEDE